MDVIDVNNGALQEAGIKAHIEVSTESMYRDEPSHLTSGAELVRFMDENDMLFHMSEKEADMLLGYLSGHDYILGEKDGKLFRGDLNYAQGETQWVEYSIDDAVDAVCEWNYEMLQEAQAQMENPANFIDFVNHKSRLDSLKEDEQILDAMFDRTKYGKEIDMLAKSIVNEFIRDLNSKDGLNAAIEKMTEQLKAGKDQLTNVSPALKRSAGRNR